MSLSQYKALVVEENGNDYSSSIQSRSVDELPANDVLIQVHYSSLNYKDALSASGNKGVTKIYPHTPGIDAVGNVVECPSGKFDEGESVIVTGFDLGMNTDGGFGQYVRVPEEWLIRLPESLSMQEAMAIGTAGLTAAISVYVLVEKLKPEDGKIIVSGATGGVGSMSVAILNKLGYKVVAITGKEHERDFLEGIGASEIVMRSEVDQENPRPMLKGLFAGAVDTVGGTILENIIKSTQPMGIVTCCGNVSSPNINLTVFPFILRGISLVGVDSQNYPVALREILWNKLARKWKPERFLDMYQEVYLEEVSTALNEMLKGNLKGRTIVNLDV